MSILALISFFALISFGFGFAWRSWWGVAIGPILSFGFGVVAVLTTSSHSDQADIGWVLAAILAAVSLIAWIVGASARWLSTPRDRL